MPYLICNNCKNSYELQEGESPEDFDLKCACGGQFEYFPSKYEYYKNNRDDKSGTSNSQETLEGENVSANGVFANFDSQSKALLVVGVVCVILFIAIFSSGVFSSMAPSYADVLPADFKAAKAPVLVELYAPRCSACSQFDSEVMTNPDVQSKLSGYSVMRINVDTDQELASRFKISVIPTMVLLDANGKEIRRNEGYMSSNEFLDFLKSS